MKADPQLLLIAGGAAAIVVAVVWRFLARRHRLSRLNRRLRYDEQPAERARAGNVIVELGLPRAAKPILRAMADEPDDRVRLSIALGVAKRQWEPARALRVVHLRAWASEELDYQGRPVRGFGPAVTRLADMGGPRDPNAGNRNHNGNGNGAASPAPPEPARVATVDSGPAPASTGNGNGHGISAPGDAYRLAEVTAPTPTVPPDGGIRWVAPDTGDRTDS
jgi:hypothetical protein